MVSVEYHALAESVQAVARCAAATRAVSAPENVAASFPEVDAAPAAIGAGVQSDRWLAA